MKVNKVAVKRHANNLELNSDYNSVYNCFNRDLDYSYEDRAYVDTIQIASVIGTYAPILYKKTNGVI